MMHDDPIYLSNYAYDNDLIDKPGRKQLWCYMNNTKNMNRLLNTSKANQQSNTVKINFGMKIPFDHKKAIHFDSDNVNTNWKDSEILELKKIYNLNPFKSFGTVKNARIPPGHTQTQVHIIHDYKQDDMYRARMVVSGNIARPNIDT